MSCSTHWDDLLITNGVCTFLHSDPDEASSIYQMFKSDFYYLQKMSKWFFIVIKVLQPRNSKNSCLVKFLHFISGCCTNYYQVTTNTLPKVDFSSSKLNTFWHYRSQSWGTSGHFYLTWKMFQNHKCNSKENEFIPHWIPKTLNFGRMTQTFFWIF